MKALTLLLQFLDQARGPPTWSVRATWWPRAPCWWPWYKKLCPDAPSRFRFFDLACIWRITLINQIFAA